MIPLLHILLILACTLITFQDFKERMVSWVLFPIVGLCLALLYGAQVSFAQFYPFVLTNIILVTAIVFILYLYTRYIAKMQFLNVTFGLGDLLFFYALALGFPTLTFLILFVLSILFSLAAFLVLKGKGKNQTVPLAGLMGLFLAVVILASFFPNAPSLYIL